jgi:hypothetical protein
MISHLLSIIQRAKRAPDHAGLAHIAKWEADGLDGDPELTVLREEIETERQASLPRRTERGSIAQ